MTESFVGIFLQTAWPTSPFLLNNGILEEEQILFRLIKDPPVPQIALGSNSPRRQSFLSPPKKLELFYYTKIFHLK